MLSKMKKVTKIEIVLHDPYSNTLQRLLTLGKLGFTSKDKKFLHIQKDICKLSTIRRTKVSSHPMETFLTGFYHQWTKNFVKGICSDGQKNIQGRGVGDIQMTFSDKIGHFFTTVPS